MKVNLSQKTIEAKQANPNATIRCGTKDANSTDIILHVCRTGEKEQFYTLYVEGITYAKHGVHYFCNFIKNLSHNQKDAAEKATEYARNVHYLERCNRVDMEIHDSPRPIYQRYEAFGIEMKMNKKRTIWYGHINSEFWDEWRANKADIKAAGYWVKRTDTGSWLLFKRIDQDTLQFAKEE